MQWQLPVLLRLRNNALVQSGDVSCILFEGVPMYWWRARVERMLREGSYEGYVREYIRAFKRTPDDDKEFVANVSRRLQTVERHFLDHRDDFFEREGLLEKLTVGELEAKYTSEISTVRWVDAISWAWARTVNESYTVYLAHPAALELFNSLLLNFSSEDVELFIGWLVIQTLAPSVSLKLRDLLFVNTTVEQGPYSWLTLERCLELTSSLFGVSAWSPLLRERVTLQTRDGAVLLLEAIENSLKARLKESDWMDGQSVDIAQRTIESMKSVAGHPAEVESNAVRYGLYKKVPDLRENFFDSWQQITLSIIPLVKRSWGYADLYTYDPMGHGVHFYDDSHTLAMPDQNLVMPYFHQAAPRAVNMGGLGALVARGFMQAFDRTSESIGGINRNSWSASTKKAFEDRYACVAQAYGEDWDERIARRQFGDLAAIHSLYKAFSPAPTLRRRLYGLEEFTPDQTFFVSFCHALCVRDPADRVARARCNVPLMNLRWFSEVFGCRKRERMNPSKRCAFW
ncbi:neprilysin-11-like [Ixodes scapularis]|uniref:neprilysin-11-like n=1 Tax=Ixodes scapularis TaxID=6945 RepID=UPI001C387B15|nr:neprilysin-11-like [Ixodes scapularis]